MIEIKKKAFITPVGLKVAGAHVEAVFSAFGNVDLDGDVVAAGAIEPGEIIVSAWNHASWQPGILPLGRGWIHTTDTEAIVSADIFDTDAGRDTLTVLRGLGGLCKWSFGFRINDSEYVTTIDGKRVQLLHSVDVFEASPVLLASNPATRTVSVSGGDSTDEQLAREFARFAAGELDRQMAAEMDAIRAGL
jgi:hypothetical protein